ncbi:MAG: TonB-dependent receptor [Limnohabitans sp.]|uniref:TonB-dependent receptor family protein n=1 Tax=Limnohabitans sp. TaxID=1907725 RepID=UPI0025F05484|nr:TonB-dependent receptor [Limnohabitans sp.]MCO4089863.1 TonB-dependent receptor [Limnohabitans sp.]
MKNTLSLSPLSLAVLGLFAGLNGHAVAQTGNALDTIVVSGSRSETKLSETPVSIGSVSRAEWDADKPKTMGEIINRIPGVFWNDLGNEQHSMGIRQPISTQSVYQYLEDGIPIRPMGVFNHNALNAINTNGASGVEVVKGAASSLYGSNAVGGAVNFLTQRSSRTPTGYMGIRHDSTDGFTRIDSGASNTWGDLGLRFSHYSSQRDSLNWQQHSGGTKDSFSLRGDYNLSATSWMRASLVHTNLDSDTPGSLFENDFRTNPGKSINTFTWRKDKTTRANVAWEGETSRGGLTTVTFFARNNDHAQLPNYTINSRLPSSSNSPCNETASDGGTSCRGTINNNHVRSLGVDIKHTQKLDTLRARLVTGVYIDRSQNDFVSDNLAIVRDALTGRYISYSLNSVNNPNGVRNYGVGIANDAAFAQLEFSPSDKVRVVAGGRYDSIRYDFKNNLTPGANFGASNEVRNFAKFSPKLGATYALNASSSLYSNLSLGFTPPEVSQLYGTQNIPNLKPATYDNMELGLRSIWTSGIRLDSAIYQLDGKDTIVSFNRVNENAGRTRSRGVELALNQNIGPFDWRIGVNLAQHEYLNYRTSSTEDFSGKSMPGAPQQTVNARIGWKATAKARVALQMVHVGSYWMDDANTTRYAGHNVFNLTATHSLSDGWEVWGQVLNLTDKAYAHTASRSRGANTYAPGAPRSIMVGLSKSFGSR